MESQTAGKTIRCHTYSTSAVFVHPLSIQSFQPIPHSYINSRAPYDCKYRRITDTDYQVHELCNDPPSDTSTQTLPSSSSNSEVLVNTALQAHIEVLESNNKMPKEKVKTQESKRVHFRIKNITHDDKLVRLYTGFITSMVLLSFFELLGPSVNELSCWGGRKITQHKC